MAAAEVLIAATGAARWPAERLCGETDTASLRLALGEAGFAAAWEAGRALPPDLAIEEAVTAPGEAETVRPKPMRFR
jgi:hypothetical protein